MSSSKAFDRAADFWHEILRLVAGIGRHHAASVEQVQSVVFSYLFIAMPNQSPEPMRGIAVSSASRLDVGWSRMAHAPNVRLLTRQSVPRIGGFLFGVAVE